MGDTAERNVPARPDLFTEAAVPGWPGYEYDPKYAQDYDKWTFGIPPYLEAPPQPDGLIKRPTGLMAPRHEQMKKIHGTEEEREKEYKVHPSDVYIAKVGGDCCAHCNSRTPPLQCFVAAWTPPNPETGEYPHLSPEGFGEPILHRGCLTCAELGKKCSKLGTQLYPPSSGRKRNLLSNGKPVEMIKLEEVYTPPPGWRIILPERKQKRNTDPTASRSVTPAQASSRGNTTLPDQTDDRAPSPDSFEPTADTDNASSNASSNAPPKPTVKPSKGQGSTSSHQAERTSQPTKQSGSTPKSVPTSVRPPAASGSSATASAARQLGIAGKAAKPTAPKAPTISTTAVPRPAAGKLTSSTASASGSGSTASATKAASSAVAPAATTTTASRAPPSAAPLAKPVPSGRPRLPGYRVMQTAGSPNFAQERKGNAVKSSLPRSSGLSVSQTLDPPPPPVQSKTAPQKPDWRAEKRKADSLGAQDVASVLPDGGVGEKAGGAAVKTAATVAVSTAGIAAKSSQLPPTPPPTASTSKSAVPTVAAARANANDTASALNARSKTPVGASTKANGVHKSTGTDNVQGIAKKPRTSIADRLSTTPEPADHSAFADDDEPANADRSEPASTVNPRTITSSAPKRGPSVVRTSSRVSAQTSHSSALEDLITAPTTRTSAAQASTTAAASSPITPLPSSDFLPAPSDPSPSSSSAIPTLTGFTGLTGTRWATLEKHIQAERERHARELARVKQELVEVRESSDRERDESQALRAEVRRLKKEVAEGEAENVLWRRGQRGKGVGVGVNGVGGSNGVGKVGGGDGPGDGDGAGGDTSIMIDLTIDEDGE